MEPWFRRIIFFWGRWSNSQEGVCITEFQNQTFSLIFQQWPNDQCLQFNWVVWVFFSQPNYLVFFYGNAIVTDLTSSKKQTLKTSYFGHLGRDPTPHGFIQKGYTPKTTKFLSEIISERNSDPFDRCDDQVSRRFLRCSLWPTNWMASSRCVFNYVAVATIFFAFYLRHHYSPHK